MASDIIDRIQKLLRLANNAGSEHEAALAAERASALMAQHEIHEAQLSLDDNQEVVAEIIDRRHRVTTTRKRVAWHMTVIGGVARSYGCRPYWDGGAVMLFGRLSAVQAATYTSQYLLREIERITDLEAPTSSGCSRSYRNAFRLGCAARIRARIDEKAKAAKLARRSHPPTSEIMPLTDDDTTPPPPSAGVIAVIERNQAEVDQAYQAYSKNWRRTSAIGGYSSGSGYSAGSEAGGRVSLGGGRGGLKAGQGSLK